MTDLELVRCILDVCAVEYDEREHSWGGTVSLEATMPAEGVDAVVWFLHGKLWARDPVRQGRWIHGESAGV